jgi:formylglycine-generating enzyme required for sulfatase activity
MKYLLASVVALAGAAPSLGSPASANLVAQDREPTPDVVKLFREEFVPIAGGKFTMGSAAGGKSEQPAHAVTIGRAFQIARYEVPQNLWQRVMGENPSRWKGVRNSVEMLSFAQAVQFCEKVTKLLREAKLIEEAQEIRLPTEAEWEYAARAGTKTKYSFGDDVADLGAHAWYEGNAAGNDPPVGKLKPNAWNLYDVHGYLWEWCSDVWHDSYEGAPADGSAWTAGGDATRRVLRGGSWKDKAEALTSSFRRGAPAELKDDAVGLRCVLAQAEKK